MYGTVANIRVKAGHEDGLKQLLVEWNSERVPKVNGAMPGYLFQLDRDPLDWIMVALFEDKESYTANAGDPEQDKWFRRLMEHLDGEPQWNDGEAIHM
jgi:quinol monooxygenase YgiN